MVKMVKYPLVLLVVIFIFAGESYGQSAWILWERIYRGQGLGEGVIVRKDEWVMLSAHPIYEACMQEGKSHYENELYFWRMTIKVEGVTEPKSTKRGKIIDDRLMNVGILYEDEQDLLKSELILHLFRCFPDTIDPRK